MADRRTRGPAVAAVPAQSPGEPPAAVQSVDRALVILELLAQRGELGVTELATELAVHKSTAFRLLAALEHRQLVEQVAERGRYRLGLGVLQLAAATTGRLDVTREGRPVCAQLAAELGETVNVAILADGAAVNVLQEFGDAAIGSRNWIGRRTPLHATASGKVLLAFAEAPERDAALRLPLPAHTARTVTGAAELRAQLRTVAGRGWAGTDEELELGLTAVAAPIRDATGRVVAALSVSGPSYRLTAASFPEVALKVTAGAAAISARLGHAGT